MYKIYINEKPLFLIHSDQLNTISLDAEKNLLYHYKGKPRTLFQPIDLMEKSQRLDAVYLVSDNYEKLVKDFEGLYKIIEAAGGVVFNKKGGNFDHVSAWRLGFTQRKN